MKCSRTLLMTSCFFHRTPRKEIFLYNRNPSYVSFVTRFRKINELKYFLTPTTILIYFYRYFYDCDRLAGVSLFSLIVFM